MFTKSNLIRNSWILSLLVVMHVPTAGQTSHMVDVKSNIFTPADITINEGDTVVWTNTEGRHNVNGLQSKYPSNPESFGNDVGTGWVYSHVFTMPGNYDYNCDPHVALGMVGKVTVQELTPDTLTVNFTGMTPHLGQMLTLYVRDLVSGDYLDTVVVSEIKDAEFHINSDAIETGGTYQVDFFADHNGNGIYDAPPLDHAWRLETGEAIGDVYIEFSHNTNFTNIFETTGTDLNEQSRRISVYPNPANGRLYITSEETIESVSIINVTGARILEFRNIQATDYVLNLDGISAGIYIVEVKTADNKLQISRLVKK